MCIPLALSELADPNWHSPLAGERLPLINPLGFCLVVRSYSKELSLRNQPLETQC
jgi:hypothetical protein